MSGLTLAIAVRCMFGQEPRGGDAKISQAVFEVLDWIANHFWSLAPDWTERLPTPANRRFRRALAALNAEVEGIVAARLAAGDAGNDLLGMLLTAQGADSSGADARQVRDETMTMLVA